MKTSKLQASRLAKQLLVLTYGLALAGMALGQKDKRSQQSDLTGNYEGTAKNRAEEVIQVKFELTEKEGALTGMIRSDHGDFTITGGKHDGADVTLEFNAGGPTGTITLKLAEDKLSGTWSAGDDGGPLEMKKTVAAAPREKS